MNIYDLQLNNYVLTHQCIRLMDLNPNTRNDVMNKNYFKKKQTNSIYLYKI